MLDYESKQNNYKRAINPYNNLTVLNISKKRKEYGSLIIGKQ